jgi:hypothetical protein
MTLEVQCHLSLVAGPDLDLDVAQVADFAKLFEDDVAENVPGVEPIVCPRLGCHADGTPDTWLEPIDQKVAISIGGERCWVAPNSTLGR